MVTAEFSRLENGSIALKMNGHSTRRIFGEYVVCASISAVFYTLLGYLSNTFGAMLNVKKVKPGDVDIECVNLSEEAFRMACIGFLQICELYPDEISVVNKVWDSKFCPPPWMDIVKIDLKENTDGRT